MPKKPAVDRDSIFTVLCSAKDAIVQNGNITTPNQSIWTQLSKQLDNKITAKALYTFVKLNRHNIWTALGCTHESDHETSGSSDDADFEPGSLSPRAKDSWSFELKVPFQKWIEFMPETVNYKAKFCKTPKREYTILKPGMWTHVIHHQIWQEVKCSCTFVFKRAKVYPSATEKYIEIRGNCKECHGHIHIKCDREPEINCPVVLKCLIKNTDGSLHTGCSKRPLSGNLRVQVSKELCEGRMEPHVWRALEATKLMDFGDAEPSHLPNLATLRKAKQERNDLELGDKDPILSLQMLKYSEPHSGSIKDIGLNKFFCHYWSQTQMYMYKSLSKTSTNPVVSFDATGSVVRKLQRPIGKSGHIFLYQGVLAWDEHSSVPVVQMLSERHDVSAITNWLTEWIRAGAPTPKEVVSDFSLALLGALVKAFTPHTDLKAYINECYSVLLGKQSAKVPPCFVRVDVAHCIKMICQWDCLKNKPHRIKDFFVRSMAQLLKSQSMEDAREILRNITIVALSETEGNDSSGAPNISERCKKYLKAQIAEECVIIPEIEGENLEKVDPCEQSYGPTQTDLREWVTDICEESRSLAVDNGDHDNMHFLPEIIPNIIWLANYLPLWTGVMIPHFRSTSLTASSANVEAMFKNIKRGLFKHDNLPIRVDRFIARHLSFIEGNMRISSAKQKGEEDVAFGRVIVTGANPLPTTTSSVDGKPEMQPSCSVKSDTVTSVHSTNEDTVENWKGLAVPPKKRKLNSYLSPCPEWLHADPSVRGKRLKVELLKNGNNQQPVKLRKSRISVLNTCAFDAFCQCLCCAFCDSVTFKNIVCSEDSSNLLQFVKSITTKGLNAQAYIKRAELLSGVFKAVQLKSGALQISAQCHISTIIETSMTKPACVSLTKQCSSQYCGLSTQVTREIQLVCTSVAVLQASGMGHLQTAVEEGLNIPESPCLRPIQSSSQCPSALKTDHSGKVLCAGKVSHSYRLGELLWIDTDLGSNATEFPLCEFPSNMMLQGQRFTLRAVIAFTASLTQDALGHYVAYCRRSPCVWEMYDDLRSGVTGASENYKIWPHAVFYTKD